MLALRLIRGARPAAHLPRLLIAAGAGVVGLSLLTALDHALYEPQRAQAAGRLLWSLPPLAAVAWLAAGAARADAVPARHAALAAVGRARNGAALLAGTSAAMTALVGSATALVAFLALRPGPWPLADLRVRQQLAAESAPLPLPAAVTLLLLLPCAAGCAAALALRAPARTPRPESGTLRPSSAAVLTLAGLTLTLLTRSSDAGFLLGSSLIALGLTLAGPWLTAQAGHLLIGAGPGPVRLLAGRSLVARSSALGSPLGVLLALLWAAVAAALHRGPAGIAPHMALGAAVVLACAVAAAVLSGRQPGCSPAPARAALHQLGAPASLRRRTAAAQAVALLGVFLPTGLLLTALTGLPTG